MGGDFRAERLKVNLRLVINRLKLLEKKKTELAQKARRDIADYLSSGKEERARIRVEHIIRDDYLVEAMEILELFCDLLLARFGLVTAAGKELDPGLREAVSTLVWAAPRLQSEVSELKVVSDQLCAKYGREFGRLCRANNNNQAPAGGCGAAAVSERLVRKLSAEAPPRALVESYLAEIAKNYDVPYVAPEEDDGSEGLGSLALPPVCTCEVKDLVDVAAADKRGGGGGFTTPPDTMLMPMQMPVPMAFNYPAPRGAAAAEPAGALDSLKDLQPSAPVGGGGGGGGLPSQYDADGLPELPSVPDTLPAGMAALGISSNGGSTNSSSDDIDFDDLTRRFEALKGTTP